MKPGWVRDAGGWFWSSWVDPGSHVFFTEQNPSVVNDFTGCRILTIKGYLSYMCEFSSLTVPTAKSEKHGQFSLLLDTFHLFQEVAYILI